MAGNPEIELGRTDFFSCYHSRRRQLETLSQACLRRCWPNIRSRSLAFDNLIWPHRDTYIWPHL